MFFTATQLNYTLYSAIFTGEYIEMSFIPVISHHVIFQKSFQHADLLIKKTFFIISVEKCCCAASDFYGNLNTFVFKMNRKFERKACGNIINVLTVIFGQFNESFLNK